MLFGMTGAADGKEFPMKRADRTKIFFVFFLMVMFAVRTFHGPAVPGGFMSGRIKNYELRIKNWGKRLRASAA